MQQKEKELQIVFCNSLILLVSRVGIEPATYHCWKKSDHRSDSFKSALGLQFIGYRYIIKPMIKSFRDKDTQALFEGRCPRRWQVIRRVAERKLIQLSAAATLDFLRAPPGNRLEALKGDRAGQFSIRINEQWRVCFTWAAGDVFDVEIVDYH
jgi:proteic killer suppression protein